MARRLTATAVLVFALVASGCGKDDSSNSTAKSAATVTQARDTADVGNSEGTPTGGSKKAAGSKKKKTGKTSASKTSSGSTSSKTSSASKKSSGSKSSSGANASATRTPAAATAAGGSPSAGDPADPRLAVVAVVRRYQKDFVNGDGNDACSLLTAAGKKQMTTGGRGRTCAASVKRVLDQARDSDIELIKRTRAGIHADDVTIRGDNATVAIGKGQRLRLARQEGRWLVHDPSP